nr:lamin tail domain-containing protein [Phytoactinopolyspora alkaliphila]
MFSTLVLTVGASVGIPGDTGFASTGADLRISEFANGGPGGARDMFVEIANFGDAPADLEGVRIVHCNASGGRVDDPLVPDLAAQTLDPGETFMIAHRDSTLTDLADAIFTGNLADEASGIWLENGDLELLDRLSVSPAARDSICGRQVASDLDYLRGESYQRVATTGDVGHDFIKAARTPNTANATVPSPPVQASDVLVSELTNGGPAGSDDDFIELANFGDEPVDVAGWAVYRCTHFGYRLDDTLQATLPEGTVIAPGEVFVVAHSSAEFPDDVPHVRVDDALPDRGFGAIVEDATGAIVDAVGVHETDGQYEAAIDSTCTQGTALPNRLDFGFGESYQRAGNSGDNAADFVKASRTPGEIAIGQEVDEPDPASFGPVQISELTHSGPDGGDDNFFELANFGDEPVSLDGWTVHQCELSGRRAQEPMFAPLEDVSLKPGQTFLAAHEGSSADLDHRDVTYTAHLDRLGFGLIVYDADGELVDRAGVFPTGHVSQSFVARSGRYSPCTNEVNLAAEHLETEIGDSYQRHQASGVDVKDFVEAPRTPGELATDLRAAQYLTADDLEPVELAPRPRPDGVSLEAPADASDGIGGEVELGVTAGHTTGEDVNVSFYGGRRIPLVDSATLVAGGVSDMAPPAERRPAGEKRLTGESLVTEAGEGFPYQRHRVIVAENGVEEFDIAWSGRSTGRNELQLYVWDHVDDAWRLVDAAAATDGGEITLTGTVGRSAIRGRSVDVLVQDGPRTRPSFSDEGVEPNQEFKDPDEYDFALGYVADTQHLSEGFRSTFTAMNTWLVTNQDARKIPYTVHVGDIVQSWMWGTHLEPRARDEYQFASDVMGILDDANHGYGVAPGNHDNKYGRANDLYNEYFPPSRFEGKPWYGGSWRPDDNMNHYDVLEIGGAKFLVVYVEYQSVFEREAVFGWANQVIGDHPDHNVIFATHEYIHPTGELTNREDDRWTSQGQEFFEEIVLPNENVFLVLSGHTAGVALNIKRDVGGVAGRVVIEMLANYQQFEKDDRHNVGFLRLLQFDVDAKQVAVNTYSPKLVQHNAWQYDNWSEPRYTDADDEFTVEVDLNDVYDKRVEAEAFGLIEPVEELGTLQVAEGETASVTWKDLSADAEYVWYVRARDADGAELTSPLWAFATGRP